KVLLPRSRRAGNGELDQRRLLWRGAYKPPEGTQCVRHLLRWPVSEQQPGNKPALMHEGLANEARLLDVNRRQGIRIGDLVKLTALGGACRHIEELLVLIDAVGGNADGAQTDPGFLHTRENGAIGELRIAVSNDNDVLGGQLMFGVCQ